MLRRVGSPIVFAAIRAREAAELRRAGKVACQSRVCREARTKRRQSIRLLSSAGPICSRRKDSDSRRDSVGGRRESNRRTTERSRRRRQRRGISAQFSACILPHAKGGKRWPGSGRSPWSWRSEEHTSEL